MDTMSPIVTTIEEWKNHPDMVMIARRGSTTIGLADENSDIDWFVVTRTNDQMQRLENVMLDTNVVTTERFRNMCKIMEVETIEALWNVEEVLPEFSEELSAWKNLVVTDDRTRWLFWYRVWLMLKNQIKQYRKGTNDNKFASKIVLYGSLLEDADILDHWTGVREIPQDVKDRYWDIRYHGPSNVDKSYIDTVEKLRNDSGNRLSYREKSNSIQQSLGREDWFQNFLKDW